MSNRLNESLRYMNRWKWYLLPSLPVVIFLIYYNSKKCDCYNPKNFKIIPRKDWGALKMNVTTSEETGYYHEQSNPSGIMRYKLPLKGSFSNIVVHHSALSPSLGAKYIQYLHMWQQLFADIGYHYVIDAEGKVYEGRNIGLRGAHVKGNNTGTIGVVILGNFQKDDPTICQTNSLIRLLNYLDKTYQVRNLTTHICFNPSGTVCPGKNLISLIPDIARKSHMNYLKD